MWDICRLQPLTKEWDYVRCSSVAEFPLQPCFKNISIFLIFHTFLVYFCVNIVVFTLRGNENIPQKNKKQKLKVTLNCGCYCLRGHGRFDKQKRNARGLSKCARRKLPRSVRGKMRSTIQSYRGRREKGSGLRGPPEGSNLRLDLQDSS